MSVFLNSVESLTELSSHQILSFSLFLFLSLLYIHNIQYILQIAAAVRLIGDSEDNPLSISKSYKVIYFTIHKPLRIRSEYDWLWVIIPLDVALHLSRSALPHNTQQSFTTHTLPVEIDWLIFTFHRVGKPIHSWLLN